MAQLKLGPDGYMVLKSAGVRHGGMMATHTDELVLSNLHVILISKGMLGNPKSIEHLPLTSIKNIGGKSQAIASGPTLDVYFLTEQDAFTFQGKRQAKTWANSIDTVMSATTDEFDTARDSALPGAAYVADTLKDTLGTFKDAFRRK